MKIFQPVRKLSKINNFQIIMTSPTPREISRLREMTGAGISDCRNALIEAQGDFDRAIEALRKKGELKAAKKFGRTAAEGVVAIAARAGLAGAVVLNSETDFVARNQDFIKAADQLADQLLEIEDSEEFKRQAEEKIKKELIVKIGENIKLGDFGKFTGPNVGGYLHANRKFAALAVLSGGSSELAKEVALQAAAMAPRYLKPSEIEPAVLEKEKEIYRQQLKDQGKPEEIMEKIIEGKLKKFYQEVCLVNQEYVRDDQKTIADLLTEAGSGIEILKFRRFQV